MNIIITMAGRGTRFRDIGLNMPKHEIVVRGQTLFSWSISSLNSFFHNRFIFVGLGGNWNKSAIAAQSKSLGLSDFSFVELSEATSGQAETVMRCLQTGSFGAEQLLVYNIDTFVEPEALSPDMIRGDGWIPVFEAEGDRWSFCKFNDDGRVTEVSEKKRISKYATVGLYYFKSASLFEKCFEQFNFTGYPEKFIAPMYGALLQDGHSVVYSTELAASSVHVLGTPQDIKLFAPEFGG